MGTRADFYVGRGKKAKWIGSIAWDGYPSGIPITIRKATTAAKFRRAVLDFAVDREDFTCPDEGWPWPWKDSATTDYAYAYDRGVVWSSCFGSAWLEASPIREHPDNKDAIFPLMAKRGKHSAKAGSKKSGIMVFGTND